MVLHHVWQIWGSWPVGRHHCLPSRGQQCDQAVPRVWLLNSAVCCLFPQLWRCTGPEWITAWHHWSSPPSWLSFSVCVYHVWWPSQTRKSGKLRGLTEEIKLHFTEFLLLYCLPFCLVIWSQPLRLPWYLINTSSFFFNCKISTNGFIE